MPNARRASGDQGETLYCGDGASEKKVIILSSSIAGMPSYHPVTLHQAHVSMFHFEQQTTV